MRRRILVVLSVLALLSSLLVAAVPAAAEQPPDYQVMDVGPELRSWEATPDRIMGWSDEMTAGSSSSVGLMAAVGEPKRWLGLDDYNGSYYFKWYTLRAVGEYAEIWVANDLSFPAGDPRTTPVVTDEQIAYLLNEFDYNMYPKESALFGTPDYHDGSASLLVAWGYFPPGYYDGDKLAILIDNVRDDNYYDPTYPSYIAGFFSPTYEAYFDRNVMTIDAYDWANRVGPDGSRPYLYEGVFAHEYQHLLHNDMDSDEENFVNEGMSELAVFLVGYGQPLSVSRGLAMFPENSLVAWGDQGGLEILADYDIAYLFQLYLYEQFGGVGFIQAEFQNPANGITSINQTLAAAHSPRDFADVYHDFSVALMIDSKAPGGGRYEFKTVDFGVDVTTEEAYSTPGAPPWGADYIQIAGDPEELARLTFNGVAYSIFPTRWESDGNVLWGGTGDLVDNWAIFPAQGGGTLTFDTMYEIEGYWDFGFVQVSTDGGYTWTSLSNAYTTSDHDASAHPTVVENLPGLTGSSGGWVNMSFDLGAYAGQDILIAFRYVTDWATAEAGWYIDNVYVDGTLISDGSSIEPFQDITEIVPINNDFTVTFVGIKDKAQGNRYKVLTLKLDAMNEDGWLELDSVLQDSNSAVMLVTYDAPEGYTQYAEYTYEFSYTNAGPKK